MIQLAFWNNSLESLECVVGEEAEKTENMNCVESVKHLVRGVEKLYNDMNQKVIFS